MLSTTSDIYHLIPFKVLKSNTKKNTSSSLLSLLWLTTIEQKLSFHACFVCSSSLRFIFHFYMLHIKTSSKLFFLILIVFTELNMHEVCVELSYEWKNFHRLFCFDLLDVYFRLFFSQHWLIYDYHGIGNYFRSRHLMTIQIL